MKILRYFVLFFALPVFGQTPAEINQYAKSVALLYSGPDSEHTKFRCTATAFDKTKTGFLFVTASHCVEKLVPGNKLYIGDDSPKGARYDVALLAAGDQKALYDFAVMYVTVPAKTFSVTSLGLNPKQQGEKVYAISAPAGIGKAYMPGVVSIVSIKSEMIIPVVGAAWTGNIGVQIFGEAPGSSGSSVICTSQKKICGIFIGVLPGTMVVEPVDRFKTWWVGVQNKTIPHFPANFVAFQNPVAAFFPQRRTPVSPRINPRFPVRPRR